MGVNQSLCRDTNGKPTYDWCTYEDNDKYTNMIEMSFFSVLLLFSVFVIQQFRKLLRHRQSQEYSKLFGKLYIQIFILVFLWLSFSILRGMISIIIYYTYMSQDFKTYNNTAEHENINEQPSVTSALVIFSSIYTFVIFICSFIINFLTILIPYKWLKGILLSINEGSFLSMEDRKNISNYFKVLKIVKYYCQYVRTTYLLLLFCQPFLLFFTEFTHCQLPKFNYYFTTAQTVLILTFYIFGYSAATFIKKNRLIHLKKRDQARIKIQYMLLIIVILTRIVLNFYYRILNKNPYYPNDHCADTVEQDWLQAAIYLGLNRYIMHLLPILLVVFIYRPSITKRIRDRSYMNHEQSSQSSLRSDSGNDLSNLFRNLLDNRYSGNTYYSGNRNSGNRKSIDQPTPSGDLLSN